jgi:glycogen operon protein
MRFRRAQPTLARRKYFQGRSIRGAEVKDIYWLDPSGREMTDVAWNAPFVRSLGVLMVGNAIGDVDERGRLVSGDTLLILLNAYHEPLPFVLPAHRVGVRWEPVLDTRSPNGRPRQRAVRGGAEYELVGRSLALLRLRRRADRRATDGGRRTTTLSRVSTGHPLTPPTLSHGERGFGGAAR